MFRCNKCVSEKRKYWLYYPKFGHIKRKILNGEIPDRTKLVIISGRLWRAVWKKIIYFVTQYVYSVNLEQKTSNLYVGNFRPIHQTNCTLSCVKIHAQNKLEISNLWIANFRLVI